MANLILSKLHFALYYCPCALKLKSGVGVGVKVRAGFLKILEAGVGVGVLKILGVEVGFNLRTLQP